MIDRALALLEGEYLSVVAFVENGLQSFAVHHAVTIRVPAK